MERTRYLDLYVSESQEHMGLLNRALLALEQGGGSVAVEEAFRAAHTLKGMAGTMGFGGVSRLAHELESLLDQIRAHRRPADASTIDELLRAADALEGGIAAAANGQDAGGAPEARPTTPAVGVLRTEALAPGEALARMRPGTRYVRVAIAPTEAMKIARALIVTRALVRKGLALRSEPEQFADDFDGSFALILPHAVDEAAVTAELGAIPEVTSFSLHTAGELLARAAPATAGAPAEAKPGFLRVDQRRMDEVAEHLGEIAVLQGSIEKLARAQAGPLAELVTRMSRQLTELQHTVLAMRMVPVGEVFDRFPRLVRDAARSLEKQVEFRIEGREIEIDRSILEAVAEPLTHLLRNALDHGIEKPAERFAAGKTEKALLVLRAWSDRSSVRIQIADDGRGINVERVLARARAQGLELPPHVTPDEVLRILAQPGFSTAQEVTDVSGRGVGMDAVVSRVRSLGGAIDLQTTPGAGTTFTLRLPVTLAIAQALRVRIADEDYAIPLTHVAEAVELRALRIERRNGGEIVQVRDQELPLIRLRAVLQAPATGQETAVVVAELGNRKTALAVDRVVAREQILVKHFDGAVGTLPIFSGVTLLPDGRPALVLDPISVV